MFFLYFLSIWQFGCLSSRYFYQCLVDVYRNVKRHTSPPVSLVGQVGYLSFILQWCYGEIICSFKELTARFNLCSCYGENFSTLWPLQLLILIKWGVAKYASRWVHLMHYTKPPLKMFDSVCSFLWGSSKNKLKKKKEKKQNK